MKKKIYLVLAAIVVAITAFAAVNGRWVMVQDNQCRGCRISNSFCYCGRCGEGMNSKLVHKEQKGYRIWYYYEHKCRKCSHISVYKTCY